MRQVLARAIGGLAVIGLVAGAAACNSSSSSTDTASGNCGYELAFFGALTGSAANLGVNIEQGFELAIQQYNTKKGSECIKVQKFDSQGEPAVAPGVARSLVANKKILGIVGPPFSGESEAADPIFEEAGIPTITPSATRVSLSSKGWKTFHRAVANDDAQGPAAANYISDVLKAERVFIADDQSAYGAGLAEVVKTKLGAKVVDTDKTEADGKQTDFSAVVQKVVASKATAMFYGGYYQNGGLIRKQLTAAGWKGTLVGGDGMKDPGFAKSAGTAAAVGTVVTCPCSPPEKAGGTFVADYKAKWNVDAGTYSDVAYDAANIYLAGIDAGNTTVEKMNTYLSTVNYTGIANTYKFTSTGELDPASIKVWAFKFDAAGNTVADQEIKTA
ncbi:branched-chain amino acid ABC transporter substrate-binding protein [Couchioplanes caeruleus]|uniref:Branched chain amino acid ABC transporter substrate-binding protein n=2 Tax=Couchioplanes caeruleus TaxID=56438 RepID=A0A1K0FMM6_9ACTN|nr:branched-chain amino acid ABC transporter substrate-binding protein [Couchioplanes caeruleus]OJF13976.1 branched chain amino acid ABC transporter substrate-binding protein [Couchioplanes caeruleus subsp. caeruleus]ROP29144.1 amino acid/amide ABC transporter substrate-binding protein (HAAT family) [Couchioplanes caeruleus]